VGHGHYDGVLDDHVVMSRRCRRLAERGEPRKSGQNNTENKFVDESHAMNPAEKSMRSELGL